MGHLEPLSRAETVQAVPSMSRIEDAGIEIPTSYRVMARRPKILEAFSTLAQAVMGRGTVDTGLKQLVAQMVSRVNGCRYCQAHTGGAAARSGIDPEKVAALWEFETDARFSAAERAALRLARDAATVPNGVTEEHFAALSQHFSEEQIVELITAAGVFAFLNLYNDTLANALDDRSIDWASTHLGGIGWETGKHSPAE